MNHSAREQRVAARLRELSRNRRALRLALEQFADADAFALVWASDDPAEINKRDQVERPYERIVDDLQEIIDFCEAEEAQRGTAPLHVRATMSRGAGGARRCAVTSATRMPSAWRRSRGCGSASNTTTPTCLNGTAQSCSSARMSCSRSFRV
jgi:hypothetical protein